MINRGTNPITKENLEQNQENFKRNPKQSIRRTLKEFSSYQHKTSKDLSTDSNNPERKVTTPHRKTSMNPAT